LPVTIKDGLANFSKAHAQSNAPTNKHKGQIAQASKWDEKSAKHNDTRSEPHELAKTTQAPETASKLIAKEGFRKGPSTSKCGFVVADLSTNEKLCVSEKCTPF
jgi:hypothetical protein